MDIKGLANQEISVSVRAYKSGRVLQLFKRGLDDFVIDRTGDYLHLSIFNRVKIIDGHEYKFQHLVQ